MNKISYSGYRFPPEIIHQAIWLYLRFTLSLRDVEDLLAERGIAVSYATVRRWVCVKKTRKRHAVREMEVDPSEPLCRRRLQTAMSCFGQKPRW